MNSKLEPARKNQLADELGLQPRQVAVWFQNRRARSKTKHLEHKYNILKVQYEGAFAQKKQLEAEVAKLRELLGLQDKNMLHPVAAKASGQKLEQAGAVKQQEQQSGVMCNIPAWEKKEVCQKQPKEETQEAEEENEDEAADQDEETAAETEGESQEFSCGTGQSEALDANSPASNYEQQNTAGLSEIHPFMQQHMNSSMDHRLFYNHQQQHMLHQFHPQSWINELACVIKPTPVAEADHLYNNYLLSLEDETASLYYELATQC